MLETGNKKARTLLVTDEMTAARVGSGLLPVFATPQMIALMEQTAAESVQSFLRDGETTVGTMLDIRHTAATPVGMTVVCEAELIEIDRRKLTFRVTARDEAGPIGEGTHERFIVESEKFLRKALEKKEAIQ